MLAKAALSKTNKYRGSRALVLSGGGMFGAYQAGAWKVLSESFEPDLVVGLSVGALNGWAIASRIPPDQLIEAWLNPSYADIATGGPTWSPLPAIKSNVRLRQLVNQLVQELKPEIPFVFVVLSVPDFQIHLIEAQEATADLLLASAALWPFFPPVRINGKLYIDAAIFGSLPLWAASFLGAEFALAINVLKSHPFPPMRYFLRCMKKVLVRRRHSTARIPCVELAPQGTIGSLKESLYWHRDCIQRWIQLGMRDAGRIVGLLSRVNQSAVLSTNVAEANKEQI